MTKFTSSRYSNNISTHGQPLTEPHSRAIYNPQTHGSIYIHVSRLRHRSVLWFVKTTLRSSSCLCKSKTEEQMAEWTQHTLVPCTRDCQTPSKDEDSVAEESTRNRSHALQAVTRGISTPLAAIAWATAGQKEANLAHSHLCHTAWAHCPQKPVQAFWCNQGVLPQYMMNTHSPVSILAAQSSY